MSSIIVIVLGFVAAVFTPVISFALHWLVAKFIVAPLIGAQVCYALNTVLSTSVFTVELFPLCYATAALVGSLLFEPSQRVSYTKKG